MSGFDRSHTTVPWARDRPGCLCEAAPHTPTRAHPTCLAPAAPTVCTGRWAALHAVPLTLSPRPFLFSSFLSRVSEQTVSAVRAGTMTLNGGGLASSSAV